MLKVYRPFTSNWYSIRPLPPTPLPAISAIPNEVLIDIFNVYRDLDWTVRGKLPFLLAISCVNWRFRSVALNTPSLWTSLGYRLSLPAHLLETFLERSEPFPFDMTLKIGTEAPDISPFLYHLHRCRRLEVLADYPVGAYRTLWVLQLESAPLLEQLGVEVETEEVDERGSNLPTISLLSGGAPLLSTVSIRRIGLCPFNLPLANITTLEIQGAERSQKLRFDRFRDAILASSHLTHLVLTNIRLESGSPRFAIELPSLRSIDFAQWNGHSVTTASAISAPALDSLTLRIRERGPLRGTLNSFSRFSTPPIHPMLRSLYLELGYPVWLLQRDLQAGERDYWARSILDCYPSLVSLTIMQKLVCQICGERYDAVPIVCDGHLGSVADLSEVFFAVANPSRPMCRYCAVLWNGI